MKKSKRFYKILTFVLLALTLLIFAITFGALLLGCGNTAKKAGSGPAEEQYSAFAKTDAFNIRQVITADSTTSRTIMWQSETEEKEAFAWRSVHAKLNSNS